MPALTHGRVKNGYNGPSNPNTNQKKTRYAVSANVVRKKELPGSVGVSKSVKLAWARRAQTKTCCK